MGGGGGSCSKGNKVKYNQVPLCECTSVDSWGTLDFSGTYVIAVDVTWLADVEGRVSDTVTPPYVRSPFCRLADWSVIGGEEWRKENNSLLMKSATASWARLRSSRFSAEDACHVFRPSDYSKTDWTHPPSHPQSIKFLRTRIFKDKE
jgi:hypothetical protein